MEGHHEQGAHASALPVHCAGIALRILAVSDLHMTLYPHDYAADRPDPARGLAVLARVVETARGEVRNSLLLDNGDVIQGNPMGDCAAAEAAADPRRLHPAIAAMNLLGYDAATVGNHEFNYGLDFLERTYAQARFPVVLANITRGPAENHAPIFPPYAILEREFDDEAGVPQRIRIGVAGFAPREVPQWDRDRLAGRVAAAGIAATAARLAPRMRAAGCDLIVALCHAGLDPGTDPEDGRGAARTVAASGAFDVVIAGHTHERFPPSAEVPADIGGTTVVAPGSHGSEVGCIDLALRPKVGGGWSVGRIDARMRRPGGSPLRASAAGRAHEARLLNALYPAHQRTLARVRRPLGHLERPVHTYFALAGDYRAPGLVAQAFRRHVARTVDPARLGGAPLLVGTTTYAAGGRNGPGAYVDIASGPLLMRHVDELYPFPNRLRLVRIAGAALRDWLERAASVFADLCPGSGAPQVLQRPGTASYDFEMIDGLTWTIDLRAPPAFDIAGRRLAQGGGRIADLRCNGRKVAPGDVFHLLINGFRATGSGGFSTDWSPADIALGELTAPEILADELARADRVAPPDSPPWRLSAPAGTTLVWQTGAGARAHLGRAADLGLTDTGESGPNGTMRFRMTV